MIVYTPITRADHAALAPLEGAQLLGVTYHYLPRADGTAYAGGESGMDADLAAVVLDLGDRGTTVITWAMASKLEGLAILRRASYAGVANEILDAAQREAWRRHLGHQITSVAASWQISGQNCPESLWAVRVGFAEGSVVIALGSANRGLDYMPDELVVIFDSSLARSYRPRHVNDSSWGVPIELT